jgi:beta-phosphoglucomutase-like phosphatase (HAD superfamily)
VIFGSRFFDAILTYGTQAIARIALDIDSTLHHYWDLLDSIARERFGVELPYHEQRDWGITQLERADLVSAIEETHSEENIVGAEPYPGAVEVVSRWHEQGHWIHVTSHRAVATREATERWLERIAMPYDDLHCSYDKVTRCVELEIDVLVDDSPVNLAAARDAGIAAATIVHPWNERLVEEGAAIGGRDWLELERLLAPVLSS